MMMLTTGMMMILIIHLLLCLQIPLFFEEGCAHIAAAEDVTTIGEQFVGTTIERWSLDLLLPQQQQQPKERKEVYNPKQGVVLSNDGKTMYTTTVASALNRSTFSLVKIDLNSGLEEFSMPIPSTSVDSPYSVGPFLLVDIDDGSSILIQQYPDVLTATNTSTGETVWTNRGFRCDSRAFRGLTYNPLEKTLYHATVSVIGALDIRDGKTLIESAPSPFGSNTHEKIAILPELDGWWVGIADSVNTTSCTFAGFRLMLDAASRPNPQSWHYTFREDSRLCHLAPTASSSSSSIIATDGFFIYVAVVLTSMPTTLSHHPNAALLTIDPLFGVAARGPVIVSSLNTTRSGSCSILGVIPHQGVIVSLQEEGLTSSWSTFSATIATKSFWTGLTGVVVPLVESSSFPATAVPVCTTSSCLSPTLFGSAMFFSRIEISSHRSSFLCSFSGSHPGLSQGGGCFPFSVNEAKLIPVDSQTVITINSGGSSTSQQLNITTVRKFDLSSTLEVNNSHVLIGVDLAKGSAISQLVDLTPPPQTRKAGGPPSGTDLINTHDLGRYIQMSFYSGPNPYRNASWGPGGNWPWNPISAGSKAHYKSTILNFTSNHGEIYVKSIPLQWAKTDLPCNCTFELWISLPTDNCASPESCQYATVKNRMTTYRYDKQRYPAQDQELPATYPNPAMYQLWTYNGSKPWSGGNLTQVIYPDCGFPSNNCTFPWSRFNGTENWAAMVDNTSYGFGVWNPQVSTFLGGLVGAPANWTQNGTVNPKGGWDTKDPSTGYIAPIGLDTIPADGFFEYSYVLAIGELEKIRATFEKIVSQRKV